MSLYMEAYLFSAVALAALYKVTHNNNNNNNNNKNEAFSSDSPLQPTSISEPINTASDINTNQSNNFNTTFTSLTGEKMLDGEFQHNNMVHFYGTKQPGRNFNEENADSRLDNMVGSSSTGIHKSSQPPLFDPQNNLQWANGAPNNTEFIRSRMNQSIKKHNENAWVSQNIGPGLTKKYDTEGTHGFNSSLMSREQWQPKTVDDLRTINNPKQTFTLDDHKGPAHSAIQSINAHTKVNKHRPESYFNNGPARYFTSNVIHNQTLNPESLTSSSTTNRSTTHAQYTGIPGTASMPDGSKPLQNFDKKNREHIFKEIIGTPSSSIFKSKLNNNESYENKSTYRSTYSQPDTNININGIPNSMGYIEKSNNPLESKKELLINNHNNGMVSKIGAGGEIFYDPNDIPNPTIKEGTLYSTTNNPFVNKDIDQIIPNQKIRNKTNRANSSKYSLGVPNNPQYGTHDNTAVYNQRNNHNRVTKSWTPPGGIDTFNSNMNIQTFETRERDNLQNRENFKMQYNTVVPNKQIIGTVKMPIDNSKQPIDSILNASLLEAFKKNPYTHSLHSIA